MKEKLLALLVAKFAGVPEAMLEGIATKKAGSVSDEAQLQSIADGIDFGQVPAIKRGQKDHGIKQACCSEL